MKEVKIALIGNTNVGKTTLINTIAGTTQHTSNYPGTTVSLFEANIKYESCKFSIIDLPGTYSLSPYSDDEYVTRKFLLEENYELIVQVIENQNIKRSLSLTLELMELGKPIIIILNNKNKDENLRILGKLIQEKLGINSIELNADDLNSKKIFFNFIINGNKNKDFNEIITKIHSNIKNEINEISDKFGTNNIWQTLKILENDFEVSSQFLGNDDKKNFIENILQKKDHLKQITTGEGYEGIIRRNRFDFIESEIENTLSQKNDSQKFTKKLDKYLLNRWIGLPVFLIFMWITFEATFTLGAYPMSLIDGIIAIIQNFIGSHLSDGFLKSLIIDGVIAGVGSTIIFLPNIVILFFFFGLLNQSGYLARTAYLLDTLMNKFGLHGKSFVPLLMGFGCNAPAIMTVRTLPTFREKIITTMMIPFMSCSARLPVYTVLISAFFPEKLHGTILFCIYLIGILFGFFSGIIFNKILPGKVSKLLLELPSYKIPNLKGVCIEAINKGKTFLKRAGKIILPLSIIFWILFSYPQTNGISVNLENSFAGIIGKNLELIMKPLGFDWRISTGLLAGLGAKEVLISVFGTIYSISEDNEGGIINAFAHDPNLNIAIAGSLIIFMLLYAPCMSVIATIRQELGNKWALVGLIYPTVIAWIASFFVYNLLIHLGFH